MRYKVYWGLGVLMILLIAVTTVVVVKNNNEAQRVRDELEKLEAQKKAENTPEVVETSDEKPPDEPEEVPISDPPVEEKPQVTEVSSGTRKHPDVMTDDEYREWHRGDRSPEEYEAKKAVELRFFPKRIENFEESIARDEARLEKNAEVLQRHPNSEYHRKRHERITSRLRYDKNELTHMKRAMEVINDVK